MTQQAQRTQTKLTQAPQTTEGSDKTKISEPNTPGCRTHQITETNSVPNTFPGPQDTKTPQTTKTTKTTQEPSTNDNPRATDGQTQPTRHRPTLNHAAE